MSDAVSDTSQMYLAEIGQVDLLDTEQERAVATRIRQGSAAAEQLQGDDTVRAQERRRLRILVVDGDAARDELTMANLRLVVSIAKRYVGRGMLLLDLVQEGNLGLLRAVERFDHTKGFKFSTYATWWIRQAITRAIANQSRTVRIPAHMVNHINRVKQVQRQLVQELGREPTADEVASAVDQPIWRVHELLRLDQATVSLDAPVGPDGEFDLGDMIDDPDAVKTDDAAALRLLPGLVGEVLHELSEREQQVVRLRYGLDDNQPHTLDEVARSFGLSRERVRQIELVVLAKLRRTEPAGKLRDHLDGT